MTRNLDWRYHRPGWKSCKRTQEFLAQYNIQDNVLQITTKDPLIGEAALSILEGVSEIFVAKGKKILHFDLEENALTESELLILLLGRSGNLRAPTIKTGGQLLVGYNQELLETKLL